ncbi:MAG: calcium/sodium antiporter [Candidatus Omnitrophica bacterium]|nr:calcium/sodium antiporter [Candidatus Omnitrophota bacterium]
MADWAWQGILFVIGFFVLVKGAHWLVEGGSSLAKSLGVSDFFIGLTVVAFGTSLPEMFIDITAAVRGNTGLVIGNIIGANVVNILFVLGVAAVIFPLQIRHGIVWKEIPFTLIAALAVLLLGNDKLIEGVSYPRLSRIDGFILLSFFVVYLYYLVNISRSGPQLQTLEGKELDTGKSATRIIIGLFALFIGSRLVVAAAVFIAKKMHISETLIGLTVVAIGSTLPELTASVIAAFKKHSDLALGNIVGSNIVNIFLVLGICSVIRPLPLRPQDNFAILIAIVASLLLFASAFVGKRSVIDRWAGIIFVIIYLFYLVTAIRLG